jgi:LemA protein
MIKTILTTVLLAISLNSCNQGIQKYDTLVDKDEACNEAWSGIDATLQRRADMIPQLVAVVKGSAAHEENTLTAVIQARANATRPEIKLDPKSDDFTDPAKMAAFQAAQGQLSQALGRLMVTQEAYPTLQANAAFHDLQVEIEGTENRILRSREVYNGAARDFNTELRHVSGKIINPITNHEFKPRVYFTADADAKVAPKIDFSNNPSTNK